MGQSEKLIQKTKQVRTHAQKYFKKLERLKKKAEPKKMQTEVIRQHAAEFPKLFSTFSNNGYLNQASNMIAGSLPFPQQPLFPLPFTKLPTGNLLQFPESYKQSLSAIGGLQNFNMFPLMYHHPLSLPNSSNQNISATASTFTTWKT